MKESKALLIRFINTEIVCRTDFIYKETIMKNPKTLLAATVASLISLGASTTANAVPDQPKSWEKCAGIALAGKNDCGALDGSHGCAGQAKSTNLDTEWVYVPKGTCKKISGGVVAALKPAKK